MDALKVSNIEEVWLVGDEFAKTDCPFRKFANAEEVKAELAAHQPDHRLILIKGSNGTRLYEVPAVLNEE